MTLPYFVQSPLLRALPGFYHAFPGVDPVAGRGARERLRQAFSLSPDSIGTLRQVHSATVLEMAPGDTGCPDAGARVGDGLLTAVAGTGVGVRTADCAPVLMAHSDIPLAAAVHVGWRGLVADVVGEAVRSVAARYGEATLGGLVAAAGPAAGGCCYEIGEDVCDALRPLPGGGRFLRKTNGAGRWTADIRALALAALAAAGLPAGRIEAVGPCTVCSPRFHSFRREKNLTGRQLSFIYIL